jgi:hypothetical protein
MPPKKAHGGFAIECNMAVGADVAEVTPWLIGVESAPAPTAEVGQAQSAPPAPRRRRGRKKQYDDDDWFKEVHELLATKKASSPHDAATQVVKEKGRKGQSEPADIQRLRKGYASWYQKAGI